MRPCEGHLLFKTEIFGLLTLDLNKMDNQPLTRREKKKNQTLKGEGRGGKYSAKHVRTVEKLKIKN